MPCFDVVIGLAWSFFSGISVLFDDGAGFAAGVFVWDAGGFDCDSGGAGLLFWPWLFCAKAGALSKSPAAAIPTNSLFMVVLWVTPRPDLELRPAKCVPENLMNGHSVWVRQSVNPLIAAGSQCFPRGVRNRLPPGHFERWRSERSLRSLITPCSLAWRLAATRSTGLKAHSPAGHMPLSAGLMQDANRAGLEAG